MSTAPPPHALISPGVPAHALVSHAEMPPCWARATSALACCAAACTAEAPGERACSLPSAASSSSVGRSLALPPASSLNCLRSVCTCAAPSSPSVARSGTTRTIVGPCVEPAEPYLSCPVSPLPVERCASSLALAAVYGGGSFAASCHCGVLVTVRCEAPRRAPTSASVTRHCCGVKPHVSAPCSPGAHAACPSAGTTAISTESPPPSSALTSERIVGSSLSFASLTPCGSSLSDADMPVSAPTPPQPTTIACSRSASPTPTVEPGGGSSSSLGLARSVQ